MVEVILVTNYVGITSPRGLAKERLNPVFNSPSRAHNHIKSMCPTISSRSFSYPECKPPSYVDQKSACLFGQHGCMMYHKVGCLQPEIGDRADTQLDFTAMTQSDSSGLLFSLRYAEMFGIRLGKQKGEKQTKMAYALVIVGIRPSYMPL